MKLSNQNIYNLRGCKNLWGQCQMPLEGGGVQIISGGEGGAHPPENPCLMPGVDCGKTIDCWSIVRQFTNFHLN